MTKKFSNEYWTDYNAFERQKSKGKLRGLGYAATGAAIGSVVPGVGTTIGVIGGYIYGVASAHKDRVNNNGKCPSWGEVAKEGIKTGKKLYKS